MLSNSPLGQLSFKRIYFKGYSYDKKSIDDAVIALSKYLISNIISGSPFVLLPAYNHIKTVISYYAILKANKIVVLYDPLCRSLELTEIIEDVDPCSIIYLNASEIAFHYDEEIIFRKQNKAFIIDSNLTDVCTIAYTNAEDGFSKGAMLTEKNILSEIHALIKTNRLSKESVTCALLPFSHLFGMVQGVLVPTHAGANSLILELNLLQINSIVQQLNFYKVTHVYSVPSLYYILSKVPGLETQLQFIQQFYSGGIKLSEFIFDSFLSKTKMEIREGYGLTESSPGVLLNYDEKGPVKNSIGKPMPGCEVKIFKDNGIECERDEIGEICIKGDMVFKGYFNAEKTTNSVLKNGWLYTGDFGRIDKDGNVYFNGLKKNMINVAGTNVYPRKLERLMLLHFNTEAVKVFAEESVLQGQIVVAQIKLHDNQHSSQEEFKKWCAENINNTLLPKIWHFD